MARTGEPIEALDPLGPESPSAVDGWLHPDFLPVAKMFRTLVRRYEGGAAVCVYHRGRPVVDLWGGIRNPAGDAWLRDTMAPSLRLSVLALRHSRRNSNATAGGRGSLRGSTPASNWGNRASPVASIAGFGGDGIMAHAARPWSTGSGSGAVDISIYRPERRRA